MTELESSETLLDQLGKKNYRLWAHLFHHYDLDLSVEATGYAIIDDLQEDWTLSYSTDTGRYTFTMPSRNAPGASKYLACAVLLAYLSERL